MTRRAFLAAPALAQRPKARIAITLDLEMSRNFPTWETTHWDYEKGNLDADTKRYALEVAQRVKARGGAVHFFCVGRVLEQEDIGWLSEIVRMGHPVGNHTYDHVYVLAQKPEDIQFRFKRAPWLMRGQTVEKVIEENVRITTEAMRNRLGIAPSGFRTPGGFPDGIAGRADVQRMLQTQGFRWISGKYARHPLEDPADSYLPAVMKQSQPYRYPETGLLEIPMSPVSDINAFRSGRWTLGRFETAVRRGVEWTLANNAVYDFLAHPSCLGVVDPGFRVIDMICDLAPPVDLETISRDFLPASR
jgi:hypothetical protein